MLWSNIKVSDLTGVHHSRLRTNLLQRDRELGKVTSYEDQLKGEGTRVRARAIACSAYDKASSAEAGMHDLTEVENRYHRYVVRSWAGVQALDTISQICTMSTGRLRQGLYIRKSRECSCILLSCTRSSSHLSRRKRRGAYLCTQVRVTRSAGAHDTRCFDGNHSR